MPILCSRASVSLRLRSKSESSGVISLFCWLSDCSGYTDNSQLTHHELKNKIKHAHFDQKFQHQPSAHTQMFVWTHTQPQYFMCYGLTKSNQTHKQYTRVQSVIQCQLCEFTHFFSYLFLLPFLLLSLFFFPDLSKALLLALQLCF